MQAIMSFMMRQLDPTLVISREVKRSTCRVELGMRSRWQLSRIETLIELSFKLDCLRSLIRATGPRHGSSD